MNPEVVLFQQHRVARLQRDGPFLGVGGVSVFLLAEVVARHAIQIVGSRLGRQRRGGSGCGGCHRGNLRTRRSRRRTPRLARLRLDTLLQPQQFRPFVGHLAFERSQLPASAQQRLPVPLLRHRRKGFRLQFKYEFPALAANQIAHGRRLPRKRSYHGTPAMKSAPVPTP